MSSAEEASLKVATVGMDERMRSAMQLFFQGHCNNSCALVHEGSADVSVVDLDGYQGDKQLEEHHKKYPGRPLIVLSLKNVQLQGVICLRKPLNPQQLLASLRQVKEQLAGRRGIRRPGPGLRAQMTHRATAPAPAAQVPSELLLLRNARKQRAGSRSRMRCCW